MIRVFIIKFKAGKVKICVSSVFCIVFVCCLYFNSAELLKLVHWVVVPNHCSTTLVVALCSYSMGFMNIDFDKEL